jgi:hypothetical protein
VPTSEFGEGTKAYVIDKVREACGDKMKVVFDIRDDIGLTKSGKHRYVISNIMPRQETGGKT